MMLRTAGGLFVFQSSVFRINEKLHNVKQGFALTKKKAVKPHEMGLYGSPQAIQTRK